MTVPRSPDRRGVEPQPPERAQRERAVRRWPSAHRTSAAVRAPGPTSGTRERGASVLQASDGALWDAYDVAMLDLDGVVYVGRDAVPGAPSTSPPPAAPACTSPTSPTTPPARPTRSPAHLRELGIDVADERRRHLRPGRRPAAGRAAARGAAVFVIGGEGLEVALRRAGPAAGAGPRPRSRRPWCPASTPTCAGRRSSPARSWCATGCRGSPPTPT